MRGGDTWKQQETSTAGKDNLQLEDVNKRSGRILLVPKNERKIAQSPY